MNDADDYEWDEHTRGMTAHDRHRIGHSNLVRGVIEGMNMTAEYRERERQRDHAKLRVRGMACMHVFIQWLAYHNVLDDWMDEVLEQNILHRDLERITSYVITSPHSIIDQSMDWSRTSEADMWEQLDGEWGEVCDNLLEILKREEAS